MKKIVLFASICIASGLLLSNIYTSLVDAKSWGSNIPDSVAAARQYFKASNPGNFFRIFSPLNQLLGIMVVVLFWRTSSSIRLYLGIALLMYLIGEGMTFGYFYPRNAILFKDASLSDTALLQKTWSEWNSMNWVRSLVLVIGICCSFRALHLVYTLPLKKQNL
jgi:hypothetical protein